MISGADAVLLLALAGTAIAGVTMLGNIDCGTYVKQPSPTHEWWIGGYVSGLNAAFSRMIGDVLKDSKVSPSSVSPWVENYCKQNPLDNLSGAVNAFHAELVKRFGNGKGVMVDPTK